MAQRLKCLPGMRETWVRSLGQEAPLQKEMATHSSTLAWRIPWRKEPGRLQSMGLQRVRHDWATSYCHGLWQWGRQRPTPCKKVQEVSQRSWDGSGQTPSRRQRSSPTNAPSQHWEQFLPGKDGDQGFVTFVQFSSVAQSCPTLWDPMDCSTPGLLVHHQLLKFTQTQVHHISDAIQPSHPLLSLSPPTFNLSQHQGLFSSNESVLRIRWPKYWSFSINPSNEYSGLISFRMDWLNLLAVQGILKSLLQYHSSKALNLWCSAFFIVHLLYP